jgi:hypothetical protein
LAMVFDGVSYQVLEHHHHLSAIRADPRQCTVAALQ